MDGRRTRVQVGRDGEAAAARFLEREGYRIIARNVRFRAGEIDLIAQDGKILVFVEVKTRRGQAYGHAAESVTAAKRRQLARLAAIYLSGIPGAPPPCRFDVVTVEPGTADWVCQVIRNAFSA